MTVREYLSRWRWIRQVFGQWIIRWWFLVPDVATADVRRGHRLVAERRAAYVGSDIVCACAHGRVREFAVLVFRR